MRYINIVLISCVALVLASIIPACDNKEDPTPVMMMDDDMDDQEMDDQDDDNKMDDQDDDDKMDDDDGSGTKGDAPDFKLTSVDGGEVSLGDFSGRPLVIFFFGSTCPLCIASAPSVESGINKKFSSQDMAIIGIDTWDGNQPAVENFRKTTGVSFDLLLYGSSVEAEYGITYDRLLVVDGDGNIAFKGNSAASSDVDDVVDIINGLLE